MKGGDFLGKREDLIDDITDEIEEWSISDLKDLYENITSRNESDSEEED